MSQTGRTDEYYNDLRDKMMDEATLEDPDEDSETRTTRINQLIESQKRIDLRNYQVRKINVLVLEKENN